MYIMYTFDCHFLMHIYKNDPAATYIFCFAQLEISCHNQKVQGIRVFFTHPVHSPS